MENALIIGASGGIGRAVAHVLMANGVQVSTLSRSEHGLDVTDEQSVEAALGALQGPYDLIFVATGALEISGAQPEKSLRELSTQKMVDQFVLNCVGPALILRHAARLLPRDRRAVFAALSARVGSIGDNRLGGWYSYRSAKAALNQILRSASIELRRSHKQAICVALHPGTVATPFTEKYLGRHPSVAPEQAAENIVQVINDLDLSSSGKFFDWSGQEVPW